MDELLSACNLLGWNTRVRQDEILIGVCPFCGNSKYNFQISTTKLIYHCWACSASGTLRGLSKFFPLGNVAKLRKTTTEKPEVFGLTESDVNSLKIFTQFTELNKLNKKDKDAVEKFLQKRGISMAEALEYKIRYFSEAIVIDETLKKRYNERVIVPLFDISGNLVFFTGRAIKDDVKFKYLNCDVKRKRFLPVYLGKENPNTVLLVEGVFDAIAVHQAGFSAIPLLSMDITDLQLFALLGIGFEKIVISLDPGEFDSSLKLFQKLTKVGLISYILFRVGEDLDCISRASIKEFVSHLLSSNQDSQRENLLKEKAISLMKARR